MLKRNSKAIAIVMTLALCLTVVAPFLTPAPAVASSDYSVIKTETVSNINTYLTLPMIQVDIPNTASLSAYDIVTVSLPSGLEMDNTPDPAAGVWGSPRVTYSSAAAEAANAVGFEVALDSAGTNSAAAGVTYNVAPGVAPNAKANVKVFAPANVGSTTNAFDIDNSAVNAWQAYAVGKSSIELKVINPALLKAGTTTGRLYIYLQSVKVTSTFEGDIKATIAAPANSGFSSGSAVVAKWVSGGEGTVAIAKSVTTMGSGATNMDTITLQETVKNSLANNEAIKLKLPAGFKWSAVGAASGAWGFAGKVFAAPALDAADTTGRTLVVTCPANLTTGVTSEGRIYLGGTAIIVDDEGVAKKGEVSINVSGTNVTTQDIVIANYVDYGVTVAEKASVEVVAGRNDTELGSFSINESIAGSLIPGRTLVLTLPSGVKWDDTNYAVAGALSASNGTTLFSTTVNGGIDFAKNAAGTTTLDASKRVLKITLPAVAFAKSKIDIKGLKVQISPDFTGDIKVAVSGTAGAAGEVKVATVNAPISLTVEAPSNIIIGTQAQAIGDIVITEGKKEAIKAGGNIIQMDLPTGATFAATPTATIVEGDITLDKVATVLGGRSLQISFKNTSAVASKIKLSNIKITTDRTIPEGDIKLSVDAAASNALTNVAAVFNVDSMVEAVIGKCVTPAPGEGTTGSAAGQFRIDSNIYEVNGVAKVMDAAPYIKAGRTYVPVRYLGYALGVAESDIVWDEATQKVTITKGDNKVELTIGSSTITVNGEAQTMEVAPEITGGRTMLPARYVAEGLGYVVGWDPATRTVLISK